MASAILRASTFTFCFFPKTSMVTVNSCVVNGTSLAKQCVHESLYGLERVRLLKKPMDVGVPHLYLLVRQRPLDGTNRRLVNAELSSNILLT